VTITLLGVYTIIAFFERQYFIQRLSTDYLGLHGVFGKHTQHALAGRARLFDGVMFALFKPMPRATK
jgi:hypothetical protein